MYAFGNIVNPAKLLCKKVEINKRGVEIGSNQYSFNCFSK